MQLILFKVLQYILAVLAELRHHRHWQSALEHLTGCQFSMLPHVLPSQGMILGGTITLKGHYLTLASFHGINFRSKYWALFNIQHPYILFSTEAQTMQEEGNYANIFAYICIHRHTTYSYILTLYYLHSLFSTLLSRTHI